MRTTPTLRFAGPDTCRAYFDELDRFLVACLGVEVKQHFRVIVGDPDEVARSVRIAVEEVHARRRHARQAYYYNWELEIPLDLQKPFSPTHENMSALKLHTEAPRHELASTLRCAFSGLVAGNVKAFGIEQVRRYGPYKLTGDSGLLASMDRLLRVLVREQRMKLGEGEQDYQPCYQLID